MADTKQSTKSEPNAKDQLGEQFQHLLGAVAGRVMSSASGRVDGITEKLSNAADGSGAAGKAVEKKAEGKSTLTAGLSAAGETVKDKVKSAFGGGGKKGGGNKLKVTNIVEQIDIGAPVDVVYNQWTQFQDWSNFMKKVENAEQSDETKVDFKAQVFWSHRSWQATIKDQVPNERIVWRSKGEKGRVEGAVTFHEIGPSLTRVLVVLEYYPQGLFERTGNLWRAQGRRARLELKHFRRHVMTQAMLHPDELDGWRGEIHDGEVTRSHDDVVNEESDDSRDDDADQDGDADDEYDDDDIDEDGDADDLDDDAEDDELDDDAEDDEDGDAEDSADDEESGESDDAPPKRRSRSRRERVGAGSGGSR